eukprot:CAMPEP_0183731118 /NCGR_PEP_ID=MMETSP0737-20130205/34515_1 /TAXON_ID=385413 /ORGANISM="Thalassiosira miniscula, Strain CCMP1093" /LENGTH=58 /DNA_ID=CAMNT_0025963779 /DNA_START=4 /DNA_END=177 /DNA_ORIENTATION=-
MRSKPFAQTSLPMKYTGDGASSSCAFLSFSSPSTFGCSVLDRFPPDGDDDNTSISTPS